MKDWFIDHCITIMFVVGGIFIAFVVWAEILDQQRWERFAADHNCKIVASTEPRSTTVFTGKTVAIATIPGTNTYLCDDGVRYTRSKP